MTLKEGKANEPTACVVRRRLRYSPHSLARLFTHTSIPDSMPSPLSLSSEGGPIRIPRRLHNTAPHSERGADRGVRRSGRKDGGCIVHLGVLAGGAACTQYSPIHSFLPSIRQRASKMSWARANPQFSHLTFSLPLVSTLFLPPFHVHPWVSFLLSRHLHAMHGGGWRGVK